MKTRPNGNRKNKSNGQVKYSYLDLMFHLSGDSSCYGIGQPEMLIKFSLGNFTKKHHKNYFDTYEKREYNSSYFKSI